MLLLSCGIWWLLEETCAEMTDNELRQIVESNARTAQAMLDEIAEARLEREEMRQQFQTAIERLTAVQEGVTNMLAALDSDRPTVLMKLNTIENKVDRLLETRQED